MFVSYIYVICKTTTSRNTQGDFESSVENLALNLDLGVVSSNTYIPGNVLLSSGKSALQCFNCINVCFNYSFFVDHLNYDNAMLGNMKLNMRCTEITLERQPCEVNPSEQTHLMRFRYKRTCINHVNLGQCHSIRT